MFLVTWHVGPQVSLLASSRYSLWACSAEGIELGFTIAIEEGK